MSFKQILFSQKVQANILIFLFIVLALLSNKILHSHAAVSVTTNSKDNKVEYKQGEILIKFHPSLGKLQIKEDKKSQGIDLEKQAVSFDELDEKTIPVTLSTINKKYKIAKIEKVFKHAKDAQTELENLKNNSQIQKNVNEQELLKLDFSNIYKISFANEISIPLVMHNLLQSNEIVYAEPNYLYKSQFVPNDPYYLDAYPDHREDRDPSWTPKYDYQWNLKKIHMEQAWDLATPSADVTVAVIDTGVDYTHPELGGCSLDQVNNNQCAKILPGYDYFNNDNDPQDDNGHGTHVSGIIAGITNNNTGIAGISSNAKIIPMKALNDIGAGYADQLAAAIHDAVVKGARIINMSWGGSRESSVITDAISYAYFANVVSIVAAGNDNQDLDTYKFFPASTTCATKDNPDIDCTITVSATDQYDNKPEYSNWGTAIDVSAPGGDSDLNILSLKSSTFDSLLKPYIINKNYLRLSGTSMAVPHVVGLASLILGKNSSLTADNVRNIIINTAHDDDFSVPSFDIYNGYGRINAEKALTTMDTSISLAAKIISPTQINVIANKFTITGSAYGQNFNSYTIDYATTPDITKEWITKGIVLENAGTVSIHDGILGKADLSNLSDGTYYLRLTVKNSDGKSAFSITPILIDSSIRENFPVEFGSHTSDSKPVIADINGDGKKEIIFKNIKDPDAKLYVIEPDGTNLPGWPQLTGEKNQQLDMMTSYVVHPPLVADIDPTYPGLEIILPANGGLSGAQLLAFHADGTPVSGWTASDWGKRKPLPFVWDTISSGIINGKTAIVYAADFGVSRRNPNPYIHIFDEHAQDFPGWPIKVDTLAITLPPILADLDHNGKPNIIVQYFNTVHIYATDGRLKKKIVIPGGNITNLAVADINGDGLLEIVATIDSSLDVPEKPAGLGPTSTPTPTPIPTAKEQIFVWDHTGKILSNKWPYTFSKADNYRSSFLNIGDINNDGKADIIITHTLNDHNNADILVLDYNANTLEGFPANIAETPTNGSNFTTSDGRHIFALTDKIYWSDLFLLQTDQNTKIPALVNGYPKHFINRNYPYQQDDQVLGYPSLVDLDGDNKAELIVPVEFQFQQRYLYVLNLDMPIKTLDWPQYLHDEFHSGIYTGNITLTPTPTFSPTPTPSNKRSVQGVIYEDKNTDGSYEKGIDSPINPGGIMYITGPLHTLQSKTITTKIVNKPLGTYLTNKLLPGSYKISFNNGKAPKNYQYYFPKLGQIFVSIGDKCSVGRSDGICDVQGNISNLNFGLVRLP